eukprot:TRINITY_DN13449_c0_g1_i2.p1 TRINITY_DN13449_c0_g1~~TRINITY_DN13449_c0_g1_i2.p1  ORF type:complete len:292 (-),score=29.50 TRINITY_DN13449_c0_g1_i2:32-880(-)
MQKRTVPVESGPRNSFFYFHNDYAITPLLGPGREGKHIGLYFTTLIGLNFGVLYMWNSNSIDKEFMYKHFTSNLEAMREGRFHTLLTSSISHRDPGHFLGNMFALYLFGIKAYRALGAPAFTGLYIVGGIVASLTHLIYAKSIGKTRPRKKEEEINRDMELLEKAGPEAIQEYMLDMSTRDMPALGASGSVMAISMVSAVLFPLDRIWLRFLYVPIPIAVSLYVFSDLVGILNPVDSVGHAAHLGGAACGLAYVCYLWYYKGRKWNSKSHLPLFSLFKLRRY